MSVVGTRGGTGNPRDVTSRDATSRDVVESRDVTGCPTTRGGIELSRGGIAGVHFSASDIVIRCGMSVLGGSRGCRGGMPGCRGFSAGCKFSYDTAESTSVTALSNVSFMG